MLPVTLASCKGGSSGHVPIMFGVGARLGVGRGGHAISSWVETTSVFDQRPDLSHSPLMRWLLATCWMVGVAAGEPADDFVASAERRHGVAGERAARFLVAHMPEQDRATLGVEYLAENLDLAFKARAEFPWAARVPEEIFLNDVLPYAVFDEPRHPWRYELHRLGRDVVKDTRCASEAAQALNREIFNLVKVHYHTGRKRPNQSLKESMELGRATCTGLSIILVNACRAVGIPARAVGTPMWTNKRGNHTWVEIWDDGWHFTGADEYDPAGLNRGWFAGDAAQARADLPRHAIYATSWKRDGLTFPMVWARRSDVVAAVDVTGRYAKAGGVEGAQVRLGVRLWDHRGGSRIVASVQVLDGGRGSLGEAETKAGTSDLNDLPRFDLASGTEGCLRFTVGDETRELRFGPLEPGDSTVDAIWADLSITSAAIEALRDWMSLPAVERSSDTAALEMPLTRDEAERVLEILAAERLKQVVAECRAEVEALTIVQEDKTLRWLEKTFGEPSPGGHSLWISLHGGGNAPAAVNDRQWRNQSRLYEPTEGIYVAPRAPTDTWNLWHEGHIDPLFQRLIEGYVAVRGVNPDRVYLLGYSAGGDGVWQLAPRMADRFAAAAMMAGHPNEASLLGLRNLPFAIFMGGNDAAYNRNRVAAERAEELVRLEAADPGGYVHLARIYEGLGHWMNGKDAEALPWMAGYQRDPWPKRVVWQQDDIVHRRFYWLRIPDAVGIEDRQKMVATVNGQTVELEGQVPAELCLRLSDRLLDLDQQIRVRVNGREIFAGKVERQAVAMLTSLAERADPAAVATAILCLVDAGNEGQRVRSHAWKMNLAREI
jgi:poly(3-hydroxybutyrate) depolymerase